MTISRERAAGGLGTGTVWAQFGLRDGERDDDCPQIALGRVANRAGAGAAHDYLYIICEPVELTARAVPVGASVIAAIRDIYNESDRDDPVAAIAAALEAANDVLYAKNRATAPDLRVVLGVTCLVVRDNDLVICQVPPTQTIVAQNGTPIALPELESWLDDYQPHQQGGPSGLGLQERIEPQLFRAALERDDLITLCSSNLAAVLAGEDLGPLVGDDPVAARGFLADLAARRHLDPAYAVVLAAPRDEDRALPGNRRAGHFGGDDGTPRRGGAVAYAEYDADEADGEAGEAEARPAITAGWLERGLREMRERSRVIPWPLRRAAPGPRVVPLRDDIQLDAARDRRARHEEYDLDEAGHDAAPPRLVRVTAPADADDADTDDPEDRHEAAGADWADADDGGEGPGAAPRPARQRAGFGQGLWSVAALVVLVLGSILERVFPAGRRDRRSDALDNRRNRAWPIGSLERWTAGRERRLPAGPWAPLAIVGVIAVAALLLVTSVRGHQAGAAEERFSTALNGVVSAREAAVAAPDRAAARTRLLALRGELDAIPTGEQPGRQERVAAERASLARAVDQVEGVQRLGAAEVQLLAPAPGAAGGRPQIVLGGGQQFVLLDGTLYAVDGRGKALSKILARGDSAGGASVGQLLGAAWRLDSLLAFDESRGYIRDAAGKWSALPLAAAGRKPAAADTFDGNLYLLEAERGQIVKFASGAYASAPQPWSSTKANGELGLAVDMTIDKDIYVLLSDGRILDFFQGELKGQFVPGVVPALAGASAIHAAPDGKFLYVADPREGRIVRLGRDGNVVATYKAAEGTTPFAGAREIAVDEGAGVAYLLTDEGLLSVRLPAPRP